jgi:tRNA U34 5-carboxymethylaminomethyl modifying GTPase MnmE/TrmE
LNEVRVALEEITGMIQNDSVLERIFSDFCVGK